MVWELALFVLCVILLIQERETITILENDHFLWKILLLM